jgi:membrane protease YdiL (CAAX protease family)
LSNHSKKPGLAFNQTSQVLFNRILGFIFFGIVPVLIVLLIYKSSLDEYGMIFQTGFSSVLFIFIFAGLVVFINFLHAKSKKNLSIYPQIRSKDWNYSILVLSAFSWIMYLFAYEFMFRGFLLFSCINDLGIVIAIFINVILYSLAHLTKGKREFIGAIPMGIILCVISVHFKSFLPAFWIHCFLAISNEWYSIKYNPEIKVKKNWQL